MKELILIEDLGMMYPKEDSNRKLKFGLYKCFCGNEFKAMTQNIKSNNIKSCGCLKIKNGLANHRMYIVWKRMHNRCYSKLSNSYKDYGNKGVKVCDRWHKLEHFIEDMYPTHIEGLTLDRINPCEHYEPDNCRWVTRTVQARNTRVLRSTNTSGYRGVSFRKQRKSWIAQIMVNNKVKYLGKFDTALSGAKAYDRYVIDNKLEHTINGVL